MVNASLTMRPKLEGTQRDDVTVYRRLLGF